MRTTFEAFPPADVALLDGDLRRRRDENYRYLMRLRSENLLQNFLQEAGLMRYNHDFPEPLHGGWESPYCQVRGHFLGHWLSAAGMIWASTGDAEIKAKADKILLRLKECQEMNGGEWLAGIPEKYLHWIAQGKPVWSPQYVVHKTLMGLMDYYEFTGSALALEMADRLSDWFYRWSGSFTREQFDDILDFETGGMLETWAQLYAATGKPEHRTLMERYYRRRLFDPLLRGEDVLTNMHANTTIPEVLGAARAYEVTGEEKWMDVVKAYWDCAVTNRGSYATGGQTCGEIWTPPGEMNLRLGEKNQEHCTVYNMMRLAEFLLRHTGEAKYADYWERNLYNGVMAQTYWDGSADHTHGKRYDHPVKGLLTYFLPLSGGAQKIWSSETQDFFCCHGSMVQANAVHTNGIWYAAADGVAVCQYFDSELTSSVRGVRCVLRQENDPLTGTNFTSSALQGAQRAAGKICDHDPNVLALRLRVKAAEPIAFTLRLRLPAWLAGKPVIRVNGRDVEPETDGGWAKLTRTWSDDTVYLEFPKAIRALALPGDAGKVAFLNGPVVLAGLCGEERALYLEKGKAPETLLEPFNEREWGIWKQTFQTVGQDRQITFLPLNRIGYDRYTVYFPIREGK